jgi:hypothetical protein
MRSTAKTPYLKLALIYFSLVFVTGFVLGPIRVFWVVPKVGVRKAELLETPLMIGVTLLAAAWMIRRFNVPPLLRVRLGIGLLGFSFMVCAELVLAATCGAISPAEYITRRDPVSGPVYFIGLCLFAAMPALLLRQTKGSPGSLPQSRIENRQIPQRRTI